MKVESEIEMEVGVGVEIERDVRINHHGSQHRRSDDSITIAVEVVLVPVLLPQNVVVHSLRHR